MKIRFNRLRAIRVRRTRAAKRIRSAGITDLPPPRAMLIHVPKVSGKALVSWLSQDFEILRFMTPTVPRVGNLHRYLLYTGHLDTDYLVDIGAYTAKSLEGTFSFAFVRNPYDRILSLYQHNLRHREIEPMSFSNYLKRIAKLKPGAYPSISLPSRFRASPMTTWIKPYSWAGPSRVFRFEEYKSAIRELGEELGVKGHPPQVDKSDFRGKMEITRSDRDEIVRLFHDDFREFNYPVDPPANFYLTT